MYLLVSRFVLQLKQKLAFCRVKRKQYDVDTGFTFPFQMLPPIKW